jgi:hypothetical protein
MILGVVRPRPFDDTVLRGELLVNAAAGRLVRAAARETEGCGPRFSSPPRPNGERVPG